jgi:hypothetical protein
MNQSSNTTHGTCCIYNAEISNSFWALYLWLVPNELYCPLFFQKNIPQGITALKTSWYDRSHVLFSVDLLALKHMDLTKFTNALLYRGNIHFSSQFQKFQCMFIWPCCFWPVSAQHYDGSTWWRRPERQEGPRIPNVCPGSKVCPQWPNFFQLSPTS